MIMKRSMRIMTTIAMKLLPLISLWHRAFRFMAAVTSRGF